MRQFDPWASNDSSTIFNMPNVLNWKWGTILDVSLKFRWEKCTVLLWKVFPGAFQNKGRIILMEQGIPKQFVKITINMEHAYNDSQSVFYKEGYKELYNTWSIHFVWAN